MKRRAKLGLMLSRIGLMLFGLLVGLIVAEAVFRTLHPDPSPKLIHQGLQLHPTYGISFTPNAEGWNTNLQGEYSTYIKLNSKGLRDQEHPYRKDEGTFRVLVLGDSFTAALQVAEEETFVKRLQSQLQQHYPHTNIEVINAGVVGYGTANQLTYFTTEGYQYQPDLVLLAFFTGNDISDNINPPHFTLEQGRLTPIKVTYGVEFVNPEARAGTFFKKARNFLYLRSRLYSATIDLLRSTGMQHIPGLANLLVSAGFVDVVRPVVNASNIYLFINPPEAAWIMTEAIIRQLNEEVAAHGGQLLVAILPDETEVDQQKWTAIFEAYPDLQQKKATINFQPSRRIAQFLHQQGILYLELLPALQAYQAKTAEPLYYKYDGHWQPAGHAVAAETIYNYLIQNQDKFKNFPRH